MVSLSLLNPLCTATTDGGDYDVEEDRDGGSTNEVDTDEAGDGRSYASAVTAPVIPISSLPLPEIHDGKATVTISEEGYQSGLEKCRNMLLGRVHLASNEKPYTPSDLSCKLGLLWGDIRSWRIIPIGKGGVAFHAMDAELLPSESKEHERSAVRRKNGETVIIEVEYERLLDLCSHCGNVGHMVTSCKLLRKTGETSVVPELVRGNNDTQDDGEGPSFASKSPTPAVDMNNGGHMVDQVVDAMVGQDVVEGKQAALVEKNIIEHPIEQEVVAPVIDMNVVMQAGVEQLVVEQVVCDPDGAMNVVERAGNQLKEKIHLSQLQLNQRIDLHYPT
ncbi:hypothetical protein ACLB2K_050802 [Fragaria x ananassa]